jgi:alpha-1,3-glucan synthase
VFPQEASYAADILHRLNDGTLLVSHKAAGADSFRYSTNWGSTYSEWQPYYGGNSIVTTQPWSGTASQKWEGEHIILQYHSQLAGSSDFIQHGDLQDKDSPARRFPHLFANGAFNRYGLDMGLVNAFSQTSTGQWTYNLMTEWPTNVQANVWGINPDGQPDRGFVFGDVDGDNVLDRLPPNSLSSSFVGITGSPPAPYLAWQISIDDETLQYTLVPTGSRAVQMVIYLVMWTIPITTASVAVWLYMLSSVDFSITTCRCFLADMITDSTK